MPINLQPTVINLFPDEVEINGLKAVPYFALFINFIQLTFISLAEGLIRDVVGYTSFAISLPADSYVGGQGRPSLRAFTVYFNPSWQADHTTYEEFILQILLNHPLSDLIFQVLHLLMTT